MWMRVLVVDDSIALRTLIGEVLRAKGFEVAEAADGVEALAKIDEVSPELIVTDLAMPNMNGLELVHAIRARPRFERTPILVVTSEMGEAPPEDAFGAGANGFLEKPFAITALEAAIDRLVKPPPPKI